MKRSLNKCLLAVVMLSFCIKVYGQDHSGAESDSLKREKKYHSIELNLKLRSAYIWRGFKVSQAPISDVDLHYSTRDGKFAAGVWGGESFTGEYTEFSYYLRYKNAGWEFSIWDINNISDFPKADIFNYNPRTTSHFIDLTAAYSFKGLPVAISWSTIVLGRDTHIKADGEIAQTFSNYLSLDYALWREGDSELHFFLAGAFAFGRKENFYGDNANIVNTGLTFNKTLNVFKYRVPVSATAMFSPEHKHGALQLIVSLF